jgi:hypothetical protein
MLKLFGFTTCNCPITCDMTLFSISRINALALLMFFFRWFRSYRFLMTSDSCFIGFKGFSPGIRPKMGDFRDKTEWLSEIKTLQQCEIKNEVSTPSCFSNLLLCVQLKTTCIHSFYIGFRMNWCWKWSTIFSVIKQSKKSMFSFLQNALKDNSNILTPQLSKRLSFFFVFHFKIIQ